MVLSRRDPRWIGNATFEESHEVQTARAVVFGIDLGRLIQSFLSRYQSMSRRWSLPVFGMAILSRLSPTMGHPGKHVEDRMWPTGERVNPVEIRCTFGLPTLSESNQGER